jgi:hypothetical protein
VAKAKTPSFVSEYALRVNPRQARTLLVRMDGDPFNASVDTRLQAALNTAQSVNGGRAPSSFGRKRRQNRSHAILGQETCERQDGGPAQRTGWGEPAGARAIARTPPLGLGSCLCCSSNARISYKWASCTTLNIKIA